MKNTLIILGFLIFSFLNINAQSIENQQSFGGNDNESGSKIVTFNNNLLLYLSTNSGISGNKTTENFGNSDLWLISTNQELEILNQTSIGGSNDDFSSDLLIEKNKILIEATSNSNTNTGNFNVSRLGIRYYYFAIFDENLNRITEKSFGGGFDEQLNKIHKINENEFWLCGFSNSQISGTKQAAPKGFYDYWIVALDSMGEYKWDKTIGTSNADYLMDIISLTDN